MLDFKEIELKDKDWIEQSFRESDLQGCEYVFTSVYIWRKIYRTKVARKNGMCFFQSGADGHYRYALPTGNGDLKEAIQLIMDEAKERGVKFVMRGVMEHQIPQLEEWFPGMFTFDLRRDESDYIYTVKKLSTLAGKKLHGKRNHIHRFQDTDDWEYQPISQSNIADCVEMNREWVARYVEEGDDSLKEESEAVMEAFSHFQELGLEGGMLKRDGKVVAYTIAEPLNSNTYVIHIEKAFYDVQGAYPMINQQFVLHNCQEYEYVNREEDAGDEGLRRAKLSYYPDILLDKYNVTLKEEE
ncbi:DUF2156 domain-containing protein [[Clostridium] polysaccharolyticum]|uniref:Phosphatidylglycerol lysyltransferase C-terminal domain-containing protein n=1 Tax=[Clostridium] polysaccharolyticum TaxID=29364 RepID=A0A1I0FLB0_9FIRM|nr:phosphatidylglycerol lysyltransferase domain-containing protein [[Clostridium] polysaccharolyticum]SET58859.1 hypothetical protein SAMN04487772_13310 [[Clostridium] polysaccharolyticum]